MKIKSYCVEEPIKGVCKQYSVWVKDSEKNCVSPLIYLQKPKWVPEDKWGEIVKSIKIELPSEYEV